MWHLQQGQDLLDGLEIKVKGDLSSNAFVPMGGEMPMQTLAIYKSYQALSVRTVRIADSTMLDHLQK